ncbi:uncharacterized protein PV07_02613 [Cladophialophora immunda]|uniref:Uncharacterized protein n=1 Tax=Cladophialophora immunda TaxID=569365 RepID=A0A0D2B044_9EURO|nr:uncharacterized protein PV07_02613 [Cladophialophora immunda]KIW30922.1 hypothetical protein PV07_02613 [Cladophialophora immunda]
MRIIATDDDFRRAAEKVLLRAEDMVQEINTEGRLLHQWSLPTSPGLNNVGPESMEVLRQLNQKFLPGIVDDYSREGQRFTMKNNPKRAWFSKGFVARKNQVIVMVKTRNPKYSEHFTKEPTPLLPDHATANHTEIEEPLSENHEQNASIEEPLSENHEQNASIEEPLSENHEQNASKQTAKSTPIKQKPLTTIPLQKLEEQCYGVIMDSTHKHHPLEIRVGDILVVHEHEGIVLKSGGVGGIVAELTDV